jgi:hypothetical protein
MRLIFFITLLALPFFTNAQMQFSVKKIADGSDKYSYYAMQKLNADSVLLVGENGIKDLLLINKNEYEIVPLSVNNNLSYYHILNSELGLVLSADSGYLFVNNDTVKLGKAGSDKYSVYQSIWHGGKLIVNTFNKDIILKKKKLPFGKLWQVNKDSAKIIYKNNYGLVWHLFKYNNNLMALEFGMRNFKFGTKIKKWDGLRLQTVATIKGMMYKAYVHVDSTLILCGAKSPRATTGLLQVNNKSWPIPNTGMLWELCVVDNTIIASTNTGGIIFKKMFNSAAPQYYNWGNQKPIYSILKLSNSKLLLCGSGGVVYELQIIE